MDIVSNGQSGGLKGYNSIWSGNDIRNTTTFVNPGTINFFSRSSEQVFFHEHSRLKHATNSTFSSKINVSMRLIGFKLWRSLWINSIIRGGYLDKLIY
jgi:hypothetical protein